MPGLPRRNMGSYRLLSTACMSVVYQKVLAVKVAVEVQQHWECHERYFGISFFPLNLLAHSIELLVTRVLPVFTFAFVQFLQTWHLSMLRSVQRCRNLHTGGKACFCSKVLWQSLALPELLHFILFAKTIVEIIKSSLFLATPLRT